MPCKALWVEPFSGPLSYRGLFGADLSAPNRAIWCDCDLKGSALRFCCDLKKASRGPVPIPPPRGGPRTTAPCKLVRFCYCFLATACASALSGSVSVLLLCMDSISFAG